MKTLLLTLFAVVGLLSCGNGPTTNHAPHTKGIELLCFHGAQRCPTCVAIEDQTRAVVETTYAQQLKDSTIVLRVIDITQPENETLADHYEVTWSSLLIADRRNEAEEVTNLTDIAFANARANPEKFRATLRATIDKLLKK
ncbi:MAG: nitrophenyl compound nitroreductase subunit ArsF family protein [Alistipes sp.]